MPQLPRDLGDVVGAGAVNRYLVVFEQFIDASGMVPVVVGDQYSGQGQPLVLQRLQHRFGISRVDHIGTGTAGAVKQPKIVVFKGRYGIKRNLGISQFLLAYGCCVIGDS